MNGIFVNDIITDYSFSCAKCTFTRSITKKIHEYEIFIGQWTLDIAQNNEILYEQIMRKWL